MNLVTKIKFLRENKSLIDSIRYDVDSLYLYYENEEYVVYNLWNTKERKLRGSAILQYNKVKHYVRVNTNYFELKRSELIDNKISINDFLFILDMLVKKKYDIDGEFIIKY